MPLLAVIASMLLVVPGAVRELHSQAIPGTARDLRAQLIVGAEGDVFSQASPSVLDALPGSTLTIRGSTSVGAPWHCTATSVSARVAAVTDQDSLAVPDVRGISLHVPVASLKCQSGMMERQMRRTIRADVDSAALYISGRFDIQDEASAPSANRRFLYGVIKVAGTERNVFLNVTVDRQADGTLHARSKVPLALTDFGMVPPRVLFGIVRARDAVVVEVDLRYRAR